MRELPETIYSKLLAANLRLGLSLTDAKQSAADAIEILSDTIGGERIYWPQSSRQREERDERIRALAQKGLSSVQIAEMYGISDGRVRQILALAVCL